MATPRRSEPIPAALRDDLAVLGLVEPAAARPLTGGRGGRTWRVDAKAGSFVLHRRTARAGEASVAKALRREQRCTDLAHAAGVGAQVVAADEARGLLLTRWIPGRALTGARLLEPQSLDGVAAALRTLHAGALPRHRVRPADDRRRYLKAARSSADPLVGVLVGTEQALDELVDALLATIPHDVLLHGDVVPGNVIVDAHRTHLVDFEYAGRGDAAFDLGNLVASASFDRAAARRLVRAYCADDPLDQRKRLDTRTKAWARVAQGAWIAWVVLGHELGPQAPAWRRWAQTTAADLVAAQRRGELRSLTHRLLER
jgi:thiamine kinase-like enzyme